VSSLLIRDALIIPGTPDGAPPFTGWLRVEGAVIAGLGPGEPPDPTADRAVDGCERALIPGLVNAHAHSHSSLTRGSAEGLPLEGWLRVLEAEQRRLTEEEAHTAALATYGEMLLGGTSAVLDMCLHPRAALRAAAETGIRAVVAPYVADAKPFAPTLEATERLLGDPETAGGRCRVWVGLHDLESCSDRQIAAGAALAARHTVGLHLHCAETESSVARTLARTGRRPVSHLAHLGALGPRTLLAHCVHLDGAERARLAESGTRAVHCPQANLKLGSGVAPVPELLAAGVPVALGTDGAKANNGLDLFEAMKFASLIPKGLRRDPALLSPAEILALATRNGAAALGVPAGMLAPGRCADLVLVRLDRFHLQPATPETIGTNLVHAARASDVDLVMVDGRIVVEGGALLTVDGNAVRLQAARIGRRLMDSCRS